MQIGARWRTKYPHLTSLLAWVPHMTKKSSQRKRRRKRGKGKAGPCWRGRVGKATITDHSIRCQSEAGGVRDRTLPSGIADALSSKRTWTSYSTLKEENLAHPHNHQRTESGYWEFSDKKMGRQPRIYKHFRKKKHHDLKKINISSKKYNRKKLMEKIKKR